RARKLSSVRRPAAPGRPRRRLIHTMSAIGPPTATSRSASTPIVNGDSRRADLSTLAPLTEPDDLAVLLLPGRELVRIEPVVPGDRVLRVLRVDLPEERGGVQDARLAHRLAADLAHRRTGHERSHDASGVRVRPSPERAGV